LSTDNVKDNIKDSKQFLEVTEMPTDKYGTLGALRGALVAIYNKCRSSRESMALLMTTLKFVYNKCLEHEKQFEVKTETKETVKDSAKEPTKPTTKPVSK
jgi:hypothetical protein